LWALSAQNAQKHSNLLGYITITHQFHPLSGKSFSILKIKEINGMRTYSLRHESGVFSVPESWTDRHFQANIESNSKNIPFKAQDLKELALLLRSIKNFSENNIDKNIGKD
jgi:hypothetical protein